jgi:hypothetical protein
MTDTATTGTTTGVASSIATIRTGTIDLPAARVAVAPETVAPEMVDLATGVRAMVAQAMDAVLAMAMDGLAMARAPAVPDVATASNSSATSATTAVLDGST